tara:strand:+ start:696 stop:1178 length:483 start_codon:yes stop_codon:yes gene_type:complete
MQHITYGQNGVFYFSTEDKRIDTSVPSSQLRFLAKFTNDLSGSVKYAYGQNQTINDRFTKLEFTHHLTEEIASGRVNFKPYGFWKYELYEVSYNDTVPTLSEVNSPLSETDTANNTSGTHGTIKGLVEQGKLLVSETSGNEQVRYTQYEETNTTNYIHIN